jgi:tropinone reductase I
MWDLRNKKALVTGGTKGIGKATLIEFLELGAEVLFTSRCEKEVKNLESELREKGYKADGIVADSSLKQDRHIINDWINENWKRLDILVNNAGINIRKKAKDYTE